MGFWEKIPLSWEQEKMLRNEYENSFVNNKIILKKAYMLELNL